MARKVGSTISSMTRASSLRQRSAPANRRPCRRYWVPCRHRRRACGPARTPAGAPSSVAEREERGLFAVEKFLDDDFGAGLTEAAAENHVDRGLRFRHALGDDYALAGRQPVGLDHDRRAAVAGIGLGCRGGTETFVGRRRYAVGSAQVFGEAFGAFELCRGWLGPKALMPAASRSSTMPAQSGPSGPTTTRSMPLFDKMRSRQHDRRYRARRIRPRARFRHCRVRKTARSTSGLAAIFQASACSRPPEPRSRIFIVPKKIAAAPVA